MKLKNIFVLVLALCMVFALCACGETSGDNNESTADTTAGTTAGTTETTEATVDDGKETYTVKVVDEGGNPISGAMVQLCLDACIPALTNNEGVATYKMPVADYKVSFVQMPAGYTADESEYYFEYGKFEMTITLKAVA